MSALACEPEQEERWGVLDGLPGDAMMWVLILSELVAFGLLLGGFVVARALNPVVFAVGQAMLDSRLAAVNTAVLVTSGWAAARAAASVRHASTGSAGAARARRVAGCRFHRRQADGIWRRDRRWRGHGDITPSSRSTSY